MSDIFISYASKDRPRVRPIVDALQQQGWSVWWDRTILAGKAFDQIIKTALTEARCVIVLWSEASTTSNWVWEEANEGMKRGILVPGLLDQVTIPLGFGRIHAADLTNWNGTLPSPGLDDLVLGISAVLSNAASPMNPIREVPEMRTPDQREGAVAGAPVFPNSGQVPHKAQTAKRVTNRKRPQGKKASLVEAPPQVPVSDTLAFRKFKPSSYDLLLNLRNHAFVISVTWNPDGERLATAGADGTVNVWDAQTGTELLTVSMNGGIQSLVWNHNGKWLATAGADCDAKVWDVETGREVLTVKGHTKSVVQVAWSPDGKRLASGTDRGTVNLTDAATGKKSIELKGQTKQVMGVAWSPDGKRLAVATWEPARVWDVQTGRILLTLGLNAHKNIVWDVAWSADGTRLATTSSDQTAKIWDATTGQELLTLGHRDAVLHSAWSPDGKLLATAVGRTAKVWDAARGEDLLTLKGHKDQVNKVAWSPDGKRLVTASADRTAKVWMLKP